MELKEFVKSVLIDVSEAVDEAKKETRNKVAIAPASVNGEIVETGQNICFEVLVNVSDKIQGEGKGKIEVMALGANLGGTIENNVEKMNKINFEVPIFFSAKFND